MNRPRQTAISLLVLLTLIVPARAAKRGNDPELSGRLDEILHRRDDGNAKFTARVIELDTGRELYARNVDEPFIPASNMKLPVSAAGLDRFGADHSFKTWLALEGVDLWVIGTGDPATGDPKIAAKYGNKVTTMLERWGAALSQKGVKQVRNIYYYDGAFDDVLVHPSWSKSFMVDWYAAPVSGLNFNDNCIDVTIEPSEKGKPVKYTVVPPATSAVRIINNCITGEGEEAAIDREQDASVFTLKGATTKPMELESKPVTDPAAFFADALRTHLQAMGIKVNGELKRADKPLGNSLVPPKSKLVAVHETKMPDILWRINKNSQNLFAEALCKAIGREYKAGKQPGSWEAGAQAVTSFLKKRGINTDGFVIVDGSGLSRQNRVTSRLISDLLVSMSKHKDRKLFRESLSVAGTDGTIGKRMHDLKGRVFAKTGYIGGVRALSGYVKTDGGEWIVFSIIYNGIEGGVKPYENLQDEAVRLLAAWPDIQKIPATQPAKEAVPAGS